MRPCIKQFAWIYTKTCERCGVEYQVVRTSYRRSKYCSPACKMRLPDQVRGEFNASALLRAWG